MDSDDENHEELGGVVLGFPDKRARVNGARSDLGYSWIGGRPVWQKTNPPDPRCGVCKAGMSLVCQAYAPIETSDPSSYNRILYLFTCHKARCSLKPEGSQGAVLDPVTAAMPKKEEEEKTVEVKEEPVRITEKEAEEDEDEWEDDEEETKVVMKPVIKKEPEVKEVQEVAEKKDSRKPSRENKPTKTQPKVQKDSDDEDENAQQKKRRTKEKAKGKGGYQKGQNKNWTPADYTESMDDDGASVERESKGRRARARKNNQEKKAQETPKPALSGDLLDISALADIENEIEQKKEAEAQEKNREKNRKKKERARNAKERAVQASKEKEKNEETSEPVKEKKAPKKKSNSKKGPKETFRDDPIRDKMLRPKAGTFPGYYVEVDEERIHRETKKKAKKEEIPKGVEDNSEKWGAEQYEADTDSMAIFIQRIKENPEQVLRYDHIGGRLLWPEKDVPESGCCANCGAPRLFEFQLCSPIIPVLGSATGPNVRREQSAIEISTAAVFTCSKSCTKDDYSAEHVEIATGF